MTFLNLLTTVAPILLIVGATLILEDDPTSVELGFLLGILLIYGVLIRVSRFIRQFDSEVLVASPEIEHQKDVLNISTFPGLRRLRVFQIIDSLNRSGDRWYNTFSKALPLLVFNVYAAVIILALLSCWLSIFTPRLRIFLILFALFLFHSLIATFLLVSHESNTLLISHLDRVKLVARRLLWGLLAILVISIGARIGAQPLYTILFGIVFWLYGYYLTGELTTKSSALIYSWLRPFFLAWAIVTLVIVGRWFGDISRLWLTHDDTRHEVERRARQSPEQSTLALTLSGGGYRAAAVHAGVLSVLNNAQVPVKYLSTVSGGSIIGAAYSLGWTPEEFAQHLRYEKPYLPDDVFNLVAVFWNLVSAEWTRSDTFAWHLRRVYFHWHRIIELGATERPNLIINTTRTSDGKREIFWSGQKLSVGIGELVAASGSFPVAFEPIRIDGQTYLDGGIVENLGVRGLERFLDDRSSSEMATPRVLIISDMTKSFAPMGLERKPFFWESGTRALDLLYEAVHQELYSKYTGSSYNRNIPCRPPQPFTVDASRLWHKRSGQVHVIILDPTSPGERCRFQGQEELIEKVARIPTLKELSPEEVQMAYWAGQVIASNYLPTICHYGEISCKNALLPPPPRMDTTFERWFAFR